MKQTISYGKRLGMWVTSDKIEPGSKVMWELDMVDETDLLFYDKEVTKEKVEKDIKNYYGKSVSELGWVLCALTPEEVYERYLS